MTRVIRFKYSNDAYGFLSNFYKKIFEADGIRWRTSEHYYQYKKLKFLQSIGEPVSEDLLQSVINAKTPMEAKKIGHRKLNNIDQWDAIKVEGMMDVLRAKFQCIRLRDMLLETEDAILIESAWYDSFWGDGGWKNNGLNMLGKCLMRLRDELSVTTT